MNGLIASGAPPPSGTSPSQALVSAFQRMTHLRGFQGFPAADTEARL